MPATKQRERVEEPKTPPVAPAMPAPPGAPVLQKVKTVQKRVTQRERSDGRVQHEMQEMRETHDLRDVDDDVEDVATLLEWHALEHEPGEKSQRWFVTLAVVTTVLVGWFLFQANFIAAITTAFVSGLLYWISQREPEMMRYRILTEGVAINHILHHFKEIDAFNVIYEPGETKTVILRSTRRLAPLTHMEIGDADPVQIREVLMEFVDEDQDLEEPLVDIWARRLGV